MNKIRPDLAATEALEAKRRYERLENRLKIERIGYARVSELADEKIAELEAKLKIADKLEQALRLAFSCLNQTQKEMYGEGIKRAISDWEDACTNHSYGGK
jgi:hypothetical protein